MPIEKKRRSGRSIGSEPAPDEGDRKSVDSGSWLPKFVHRPMPIPADRAVPSEEILKRAARERD